MLTNEQLEELRKDSNWQTLFNSGQVLSWFTDRKTTLETGELIINEADELWQSGFKDEALLLYCYAWRYYLTIKRFDLSSDVVHKARRLSIVAGNRDMLGLTMGMTGLLYIFLGDFLSAIELFELGKPIVTEDEKKASYPAVLFGFINLGEAFIFLERLDEAEEALTYVSQRLQPETPPVLRKFCNSYLGRLRQIQGRYAEANDLLLTAVEIESDPEFPGADVDAQVIYGTLLLEENNTEGDTLLGMSLLLKGVDAAAQIGHVWYEMMGCEALAQYFTRTKETDRAIEFFTRTLSSAKRASAGQRQLALERSRIQERQLQIETRERLLYSIFPSMVAERLISGDRHAANEHPSVTVMFLDIVGFSSLSASRTSSDVVSVLDMLFSQIDEIVSLHGVEKVKTIGDAYMAVGGAPEWKEGHTHSVINAALDILEWLKQHQPDIEVRIGIHAGPVTSGVIGSTRTVWDIWGDTVNIAARLEETGVPMKIHVSDEIVRSLDGARDKYSLTERGEVELIGRGMWKTWLIE